MKALVETDRKVFMTKKEKELKKRLIALLKDDGKGHHHAKYAARLADFDINIVPLKKQPDFTAAISFEDGIIYISEGFLNDPSTFGQLNVLMRHELAHNLLMHEIRMMHKIGSYKYSHIKYSQTIHDLLNIIMDYEISNKKYSAEDKITVRNMYLNGQLIGGLVTEDDRQNWAQMSVEEMYDALGKEIQSINEDILSHRDWRIDQGDFINKNILKSKIYNNVDGPAQFRLPIDKLIESPVFKKWPSEIQDIITDLYTKIVEDEEVGFSEKDLQDFKNQITRSSIFEAVDITSPYTGEVITTLYTPEEKQIVIEVLKSIAMYTNAYTEWYTKVKDALGNNQYSSDEIKAIFDGLVKERNN